MHHLAYMVPALGLLVSPWMEADDYFTLLRVVVCAGAVWLAWTYWLRREKRGWIFGAGVMAILFNPLTPVRLDDRELWAIIDWAFAAGLIAAWWFLERPRLELTPTQKRRYVMAALLLTTAFLVTAILPELIWPVKKEYYDEAAEANLEAFLNNAAEMTATEGVDDAAAAVATAADNVVAAAEAATEQSPNDY